MMNENKSVSGDKVLLLSMPWGTCVEPSLGVAILKSVLNRQGIGCDVVYAPLRLLRYVKFDTWYLMSRTWAANDFVFTREFEEQVSPEQLDVLRRLIQDSQDCIAALPRVLAPPEPEIAKILRLRQEIVPRFFDDLIAEIDFSQYSLVGFSCLFDQTVASLALARRLKREHPKLTIAFGGYALQQPVGPALQKAFPEMDVVAYGDGEPVIFPLWEAVCGIRPLSEVPNISYRNANGEILDSKSAIKINLDDSPTPDFDDFFRQREELKEKHGVSVLVGEIPVESSRGCWYGQKSHCTFCGIDDETLKYRVKSARVSISQLDQLYRRYNVDAFRFSDYIMPLQYYQDFLPTMAKRGAPYTLHYETKANLKESQIELCAAAGIRYLQPGIESLNTSVLKLMAKGVSAAQNIFTLFTMFSNGIYSFYNLIFGFPFESRSDYEQIVRLIPSLYHLIPPQSTVPVLVTRYAPLASDPERFGASGPLKAHWRYDVIFSRNFRRENNLAMEHYCYYYESPYREFDPQLKVLYEVLQHQVLKWRERFESGNARLTYEEDREVLIVRDSRLSDEPQVYRFASIHRMLGEVMRTRLCNGLRLFEEMRRMDVDQRQAELALDELVQARIVLEVDACYVWLAQPEGCFERTFIQLEPQRANGAVRRSDEWPPVETDDHALTDDGSPLSKQERRLLVLPATTVH